MAYIGPEPNPGQNREVDDISSGFNGSEVNFTLQVSSQNVSPGSSNAIIVSLGGVVQNPGTDYTVAASTLTFTTAPTSGLAFFGLVLGQQVDTEGTADNSITTTKIVDQAVTLAKLPHGTGSNDGKFLRANNGADPSFETVTSTTINNNADNRIITGSGTANTLNGESACTFDGTAFIVNSSDSVTSHAGTSAMSLRGGDAVNDYVNLTFRGNAYAVGGVHGKTEAISGTNGSGSLTFSTANSGTITERVQINQNGHFYPVANDTYDLGLSSNRWRNIYTNDLNLSNEGSSNDVDGTWGSYTIQEGSEDLFLINKRNGKKFKFNLTEVA